MINESFIKDAQNEFREHRKKWSVIYGLKFFIWLIWCAGSLYGIIVAHDFLTTLIFQLLLGAAFAHGVELQHQALHQTGFKSRKLNRLAGFTLGIPMLVSYSAYQDSHLFHHRALGTPEDEEFFNYGDKSERKISTIFKHFFLVNHFCEFLKNLIDALNSKKFVTKAVSKNGNKMRVEYIFIGVVFFGCAGLSVYFNSHFFIKAWLVPLFLIAAPIHALIELPEHYECDSNSNEVYSNTRSIKSNWLSTWFTNGNNYHVEHHWYASLPMEKMASIHQQIEPKIVYKCDNYFSFYKTFFSELISGNKKPLPQESQETE